MDIDSNTSDSEDAGGVADDAPVDDGTSSENETGMNSLS